ncbi:MAG: response regulator [Candidatus Omnitrophica bacterium]|nr:response regulator [Candidatus Omnitrophota bacterium]
MTVQAIKVLIVDDEAEVRALLRHFFELQPYVKQIDEAGSGQAALKKIQASMPDLMLVDILLPAGGGMYVLESVRANQAYHSMRIVGMSGYADMDVEMFLKAGGNDFIAKPFHFYTFQEKLNSLLGVSDTNYMEEIS